MLPIGWIVLNVIFLYQLTDERGLFTTLRQSITGVTTDARLQLLLVAFCLRRVLRRRGRVRHAGRGHGRAADRPRLHAAGGVGLSLIANTAPVAFGALGTPIIALSAVSGLDLRAAQRHGRPPAPALLADRAVLAGRGVRRVARDGRGLAGHSRRRCAVRGAAVSDVELHGPWLVDVVAAIASMASLVLFLRVWRPQRLLWTAGGRSTHGAGDAARRRRRRGAVVRAWMPWIVLSVLVFVWGLPQ